MIRKLRGGDEEALLIISDAEDFPQKLTKEDAAYACTKRSLGAVSYGAFEDGQLVGIMTGTFMRVFPHSQAPNGKIVHVSGAYVKKTFRKKGYGKKLLDQITKDAFRYGAFYLCTDAVNEKFFQKMGWKSAPTEEARMWKPLRDPF